MREREVENVEQEPTFQALGLSQERLAAVEALGWDTPTPIQWKAIPEALKGKDIVGIAQTGTGKTGAFLLSGMEQITAGGGLQIMVLCPTRELAQQVADDARMLSMGTTLRAADIVGGMAYGPQEDALRTGVEIIAATPGRMNDLIEKGTADLGKVKIFILDEADRMLDMGFRPQIESILRKIPRERQGMLFSATMPNGVHALALQVTRDPVWVEATPEGTTAEGITELVYSVKPEKKPDLLVQLLEEPGWDQVLVFSRTKAGANSLERRLTRAGVKVEVMHSDRQMSHRTRALDRFATGSVRVLVATDIAQRGLDVEGISHVVNYDIPTDPEDYVHRIGRTGRAGAAGTAVTFVTAGDLGHLKSIQYRLGRTLERIHLRGFDYAGAPTAESARPEAKKHSRSGLGFGGKSAKDLTPEELEALLNPG
ncbi:MAG: DEAD/DEAH box helicase [Gemmatimonadota bacterium]